MQQEVSSPTGTGQRRPSRSPRNQRSRSADVDCLKKYTERRVEDRRHTELPDASKLDPTRWIPLPKTRSPPSAKKLNQSKDDEKRGGELAEDIIGEPSSRSSFSTGKRMSPTKEEDAKDSEEQEPPQQQHHQQQHQQHPQQEARLSLAGRQARSQSTDVSQTMMMKHEKVTEERRNTEVGDPRMIAARWIPQINTSRFRYDASALARIGSSCDSTKSSATRWMTFTKIPSPCPVPRVKPERKPSVGAAVELEQPRKAEAVVEPTKDAKADAPKWEPTRKFSPTHKDKEFATKKQDEKSTNDVQQLPSKDSPDSVDPSSNLSQRMKDLYDFKTENEWPKRLSGPRRGNTWISKSSSEEEKTAVQPVRRKSQDLEFNERIEQIQLRETKIDAVCPEESKPSVSARKSLLERNNEVFDSDFEERLKRFHERLRFSEDLGIPTKVHYKVKGRRTYSDDHEEKTRRASCIVRGEDMRKLFGYKDQKRDSTSSQRSSFDSRASYSEKIPRRKSMGSRSASSDAGPLKNKPAESKNQSSGAEPSKQKGLETRSNSMESQPPKRKLPDVRGRSWEVDFPPRRMSEERRKSSVSAEVPKKKVTESKSSSAGTDRPRHKPLESRSNSAEGRPAKREMFTSKTSSVDVEASRRRCTESRGCSSDVEAPRKKSVESRGSYSDAENSKRKSVDSRGSYSESSYPKRDSCTSNVSYACSDLSKPTPRASTSTYVEIDFSKRNSRTSTTSYMSADLSKRKVRTSDASYVSVDPHAAKRSSMDYRGSRQIELPPRRAFSQTDEKQAAPVAPAELKDDRQRKINAERQQRDSTRYKVYLT